MIFYSLLENHQSVLSLFGSILVGSPIQFLWEILKVNFTSSLEYLSDHSSDTQGLTVFGGVNFLGIFYVSDRMTKKYELMMFHLFDGSLKLLNNYCVMWLEVSRPCGCMWSGRLYIRHLLRAPRFYRTLFPSWYLTTTNNWTS